MKRPLIGITVDNVQSSFDSGRYESNIAYSRAVVEAGGLPLLLPQEVALAPYYVALCDGLMLTGGDDARTDTFGVPLHPQARCIAPQRQAFELALLDALAKKPQKPALGVCLGMQLMSLHAGGKMNQHLPDTLPAAVEQHQNNHRHGIRVSVASEALLASPGAAKVSGDFADETIVSSHHQAVVSAGALRVIAASHDGVIEAVDDPSRAFYLGVQWHPERCSDGVFNLELIRRFVAACS